MPTKATSGTNMNRAANQNTGVDLGFEAVLWAAADILRSNMDVAEYKHAVLGLIFPKYISEVPAAKHAEPEAQRREGAVRHGRGVMSEARLRETPLPKLNCSELGRARTIELMEGAV